MGDAEIELAVEPAPLAPPSAAAEAAVRERERMGDVHIQRAVEPAPLAPPSAAAAAAEATAAAAVAEAEAEAAMIRCLNWTPLHMAASRGHQRGFQALLNGNPELAEALDSQQRSPLHLASANGHIEIVQALIGVRPEMCLARDQDGANPLHVAAMRGKVDVLDALFQANRHAARATVNSGEGETILHLCVKYNQLEFLKRLLENYFKGEEFVNAKDNAGNTILHLAVADRRLEIIKHVLRDSEINVTAMNARMLTAMDILRGGKRRRSKLEGLDRDIESLLGLKAFKSLLEHNPFKIFNDSLMDPMVVADMKNGIIVAAALVATLAFQSAVAPPGGVWQDNNDGHEIGKAVIAFTHPALYESFLFLNNACFVSSLFTVYVMMSVSPKRSGNLLPALLAMGTSIVCLMGTYIVSIPMVFPVKEKLLCFTDDHTHITECTSYLQLAIPLIPFAGVPLIPIVAIIMRMRNIRRWKERVNRAGLANPAPVGEANA